VDSFEKQLERLELSTAYTQLNSLFILVLCVNSLRGHTPIVVFQLKCGGEFSLETVILLKVISEENKVSDIAGRKGTEEHCRN